MRQLLRMVDAEGDAAPSADALGRVAAWAYPERIARRRAGPPGVYLCEDGGEARVHEKDPLAAQEWLAIAHWEPSQPRKIRLAAALDLAEILRDHAARLRSEDIVRWDAASESVQMEQQRALGAIVLERKPLRGAAIAERVRTEMLKGVQQLGVAALPWSEATRQWQARVLSLRGWRPQESWTDVSDAALAAMLGDWLAPYLDGVTRREHLARLNLGEILNGLLDYERQRQLARLAPAQLPVPSGSNVALEYFPDARPPVLSVKLQELFGLARTPAVNDGRTPVLIRLLSPARQPLAVTQDLAGFWARTYPEVKKEMKGRYPRHPWPDDPMSAPPTRRAKPRGT
jgi:ATP-dependent helicase HrpB